MNQVRLYTQALQPVHEDAVTLTIDTAYTWHKDHTYSGTTTWCAKATVKGSLDPHNVPDLIARVTTPNADQWCRIREWKYVPGSSTQDLVFEPLHPETQAICHAVTGTSNG